MRAHIECASEEHLNKTWSKLLKTTERLSELEVVEGQIEDLQTESESMKKLLDKNGEEISDLRLSEKKLEVENMELKKGVAELRRQLEEVKRNAACEKDEISSLKRLVQTMQTKIQPMNEKQSDDIVKIDFDWDPKPIAKDDSPICTVATEVPYHFRYCSRYVYGNFPNYSIVFPRSKDCFINTDLLLL